MFPIFSSFTTAGCIIAPGGEIIVAASANEETILTATVSLEAVLRSKARLDVGGHYSRPDVLKLLVNSRPMERVVETIHADPINHDGLDVRFEGAFGAFSSVADNGQESAREVPIDQTKSQKSR